MSPQKCSFLLLLLICGGQQQTSAKTQITYGIDEFIEDVSFIPGAKLVLTSAVKIWLLYGEVHELINPNSTFIAGQLEELSNKLNVIDEHLDQISGKIDVVSENLEDLKNFVEQKLTLEFPKHISYIQMYNDLHGLITKVTSSYDHFKSITDPSKNFPEREYKALAETIKSPLIDQLISCLRGIKDKLIGERTTLSMLDILIGDAMVNNIVCNYNESPLHTITMFYKLITIAEFRALGMIQYANSVLAAEEDESSESRKYEVAMERDREESYKRIAEIIRRIKPVMMLARPDFWRCDNANGYMEGKTHTKLGPIFQKYLIKEKDIRIKEQVNKEQPDCKGICRHRQNGTDVCNTKHCKDSHKRQCRGRVVECDTFKPKLTACLSEKSSERRYEFLEDPEDGHVYGNKKSCRNPVTLKLEDKVLFGKLINWHDKLCEFCLCTCLHNGTDMEVDRYFSLREVTSDIEDQKVVTGIKFTKKNRILHIQIKQGTIAKNGQIKKSSWKPADNFTVYETTAGIDYHTVTWEERTVNLDDLKTDETKVLTGLRFKKSGDGIKLEIRLTPFNFADGQLFTEQSAWISHADDVLREEYKLDGKSLPQPSEQRHPQSSDKQFLKFTTSSMEDDVGQTVVPLIDLSSLEANSDFPLAGAGLMHKAKSKDSAGFLAFKLFTYNFAKHLEA